MAVYHAERVRDSWVGRQRDKDRKKREWRKQKDERKIDSLREG